jgi:hypothetical protein
LTCHTRAEIGHLKCIKQKLGTSQEIPDQNILHKASLPSQNSFSCIKPEEFKGDHDKAAE